jgi:hypothetical protein
MSFVESLLAVSATDSDLNGITLPGHAQPKFGLV